MKTRKKMAGVLAVILLLAAMPLAGIAIENNLQTEDVQFGDRICTNAGKQYQWPGIVTAVYRSGVVVVDTWHSSMLLNATKGQCQGKVEIGPELQKASSVMYGLSNVFVSEKSDVNISVNFINNFSNSQVAGLIFGIQYDNKTLNLTGIKQGSLTSDWDIKFNLSTGRVVLVYNQTMIGKAIGTVAELRFSVLDNNVTDSQIYIKTGKEHNTMYIANQEGEIDLITGNVGYVYNDKVGR